MTTSELNVAPASYDEADVRRLVAAMHDDIELRYADVDPDIGPPVPPPGSRPAPRALPASDPRWDVTGPQVTPPAGVFVLARIGGDAAGCGAIRRLPGSEPGIGEVKRLYTAPWARRRGVARAVLDHLVGAAPALGFHRLVLETGERQPEAIAFYEADGWYPVVPYGEFARWVDSRCFGLDLSPPG